MNSHAITVQEQIEDDDNLNPTSCDYSTYINIANAFLIGSVAGTSMATFGLTYQGPHLAHYCILSKLSTGAVLGTFGSLGSLLLDTLTMDMRHAYAPAIVDPTRLLSNTLSGSIAGLTVYAIQTIAVSFSASEESANIVASASTIAASVGIRYAPELSNVAKGLAKNCMGFFKRQYASIRDDASCTATRCDQWLRKRIRF